MFLHLIDGTYELFRQFYGAPSRRNAAGQEVGAARSLLRALAAMVSDPEVTHLACAFDHQVESFRNDLFDGYKTGEGIEPELFAQFPLAEDAARALGIVVWPMVEFEADDALATAAARWAAAPGVDQVRICSPDKDLAQCVRGAKVVLFDRRAGTVLTEAGVIAKFGVPPTSIADYLALVGDDADGVPGVPRWGAKSTATVLGRYLSLDNIPDDAGAWDVSVRGRGALAKNLREHRKQALLYRTLTRLRLDVPLAERLEDLRWRGPDEEALARVAEVVEDPAIADRLRRPPPVS